jgi:Skp family chaperone for outer membrane proteins
MPIRRIVALATALVFGAATLIAAQDLPQPSTDPGFRVLDQDRLFTGSRLGQELLADLRQAEEALERENQALADQLAAEERALTDLRASLSPEAFREQADDFDRRVEIIRAERSRLSQDLAQRYETEAQRFFQTALPVLSGFLAEQGIIALLRPEAVILGADWLDITDLVIERIDAATAP